MCGVKEFTQYKLHLMDFVFELQIAKVSDIVSCSIYDFKQIK